MAITPVAVREGGPVPAIGTLMPEVTSVINPRIPVLLVLTGLLVSGMASSTGQAPTPGQAASPKLYLLQVTKGQLPTDTGLDDKTKPEIVDNYKELGGKAMKVAFAPGDSFGIRPGQPKNWKQYALIRTDVFNTGKDPVAL